MSMLTENLEWNIARRRAVCLEKKVSVHLFFFEIKDEDAGKVLAIDTISRCEYSGFLNEIYVGEKLDIVRYDEDPAIFIENALSPAKDLKVAITDPKKKEALVIADGDNFSLAIGKKGQNARLASRLTHFKIDIKTTEQAREAGINFR